jgi:sec-independent protein translocase protein TatC
MKTKPSSVRAEMSFLDHLEELRWHLVRSVIAIMAFAILAFLNKSIVFDKIILAPKNSDFWTYRLFCSINEALCIKEIPFTLLNIDMAGQFTTHLMISFFVGLIIAFPYVCWELWKFIEPALYPEERKYSKGLVAAISFLFFTGVAFGYFFVAPLSVNFLGSYRVSEEVVNQINLLSYIRTVSTITLATGFIFELPIMVFFLTKIGIVTPGFMRTYRKHSIVGILVLSAIITPPDISSQILVSIPLVILYEISIYISAAVIKKQELKT